MFNWLRRLWWRRWSFRYQRPHDIRALHFVLKGVTQDKAYRLIDLAHKAGFNTLIVSLADAVKWNQSGFKSRNDAISKEVLKRIVNYARINGLRFIPELVLLTHQENFLGKSRPELMYNAVTYSPNDKRVYNLLSGWLPEVIETIEPDAIHIGHDEVAGLSKWSVDRWLEAGEEGLPAKLFLADVLWLHRYLTKRNIQVWMWGDMLIAPDEFPTMKPGPLHGIAGYSELSKHIPADITICDWHYFEKVFKSSLVFQLLGHDVLGAVWRDTPTITRFSDYIRMIGGKGMIATTWSHVQRDEWSIVEEIIDYSGKSFRGRW